MKAIRIHNFGGPDVLQYEDVPEPRPGQGDIRIRVIAAGVNPADWKIREGGMKPPLPLTMGLDVAGVVDMVGSGVDTFQIGDAVFAKTVTGQGGYAEYTVVNAAQAARKPANISFVEAAAIPTAALTACQALFDTASCSPGRRSSSTALPVASAASPCSSRNGKAPA